MCDHWWHEFCIVLYCKSEGIDELLDKDDERGDEVQKLKRGTFQHDGNERVA